MTPSAYDDGVIEVIVLLIHVQESHLYGARSSPDRLEDKCRVQILTLPR